MEKNTILAITLSTLVIIVFSVITGMRNQQQMEYLAEQQAVETPVIPSEPQPQTQIAEPQVSAPLPSQPASPSPSSPSPLSSQLSTTVDTNYGTVEHIKVETDLLTIVLSNVGGDIVSWKLKEHSDKEDYVEMIFAGDNEPHAFTIAFGGLDAKPETTLFQHNWLTDYSIEFYRDFSIAGTSDGTFRLTKRYDFKPNEYMFEMTITLDGGNSVSGVNFAGSAYTLSFGPQIGPKFFNLSNYYDDYRRYYTYTNGKRKEVKANDIIDSRPAWAAITGKYFVFIAIPYLAQYSVSFSDAAEPGLPSASRFNIIRPATTASRVSDIYRFYLGPKSQDSLIIYNNGQNSFALKDVNLSEISSSRGPLGPLERLLKWLLLGFYKIVPNYGIAIILLTLLVKIVFFPLTKKGSEATLRMQALAPKIKELQEKYKDNRQKLNAEMAVFYQKEGYNPISGCLPMLLQIPIFIAMYQLFNNHFDLRGAAFIPGWIPDLSVPEAIVNFPEGVKLPILGWTALRGLPFIYVASQLLYGKVTQMPGQQSNTQMKMMLYVMPIVFFFVLYNVPSGLLIYWIFSNLLTLVQQLIINKFVIAKRKQQEALQPQPVIAPGKKKKNKR